jgi:hypothetical protein
MKSTSTLLIIFICLLHSGQVFSQKLPLDNQAISELSQKALSYHVLENHEDNPNNVSNNNESLEGFFIQQEKILAYDFSSYSGKTTKSTDTLIIGAFPGDSVYITGSFFNNGPILVLSDGKLTFENADAQILGDLIVWGTDAVIEIRNSTLHFPQQYLYQRSFIAASGGRIQAENSMLGFSGLSHNLVITDSASVHWKNITKSGFTTCGLSKMASVSFDNAHAAEFVITDSAQLSFENSSTILLWHHIKDMQQLVFSFPDGDSLASFAFSSASPGVLGLNYSYSIDSCTDVMWGLMPEPGSHSIISDSKLRTVGVWFLNQPTFQVSGLVNNSMYASFTAPLSDHSLVLNNTQVITWSLYLFENAHGTVENCILGEIGMFRNSSVEVMNTFVDGSGGYLFAEDTTFIMYGFSHLTNDFHVRKNAIGVFAYSGQNLGRLIARERSIMFVLQSNTDQMPELYGDAMVWYLKLEGTTLVYSDSLNVLKGSAWIDKASAYYPNDLAWYEVHYRISDTLPWMPISGKMYQEVFSEQLCVWNTAGLLPCSYLLRLTMCDNTPDSNKVEVLRSYVMMPWVANVDEVSVKNLRVFPNPSSGKVWLQTSDQKHGGIIEVSAFTLSGKLVLKEVYNNKTDAIIDLTFANDGMYLLRVTYGNGHSSVHRIIKH